MHGDQHLKVLTDCHLGSETAYKKQEITPHVGDVPLPPPQEERTVSPKDRKLKPEEADLASRPSKVTPPSSGNLHALAPFLFPLSVQRKNI